MTARSTTTPGAASSCCSTAATYPYQSVGATDATLLARAGRYRLPEAIWRVGAQSTAPILDRERMGMPHRRARPATSPTRSRPSASRSPIRDDLTVWWGMGALTAWPVVPLTVQTIEQYDLWDTTNFRPFAGLRALTGDLPLAQQLAAGTADFTRLRPAARRSTPTPTAPPTTCCRRRRTTARARSAAQHPRLAGDLRRQRAGLHHTIRRCRSCNRIDWRDDPDAGYWTGEASMPRSAQFENVGIHIYAPQYSSYESLRRSTSSRYEPYTHAYVPQDHFDEVVQDGPWTFARFRRRLPGAVLVPADASGSPTIPPVSRPTAW